MSLMCSTAMTRISRRARRTWSQAVSFGPTPERRSLDRGGGTSHPSEPARAPSRSLTIGSSGRVAEALARRFARRVLAFNEVHSLALDPARGDGDFEVPIGRLVIRVSC